MGLSSDTMFNIVLGITLGVLLVLFIQKSTRNRHYVPYFILSFVSIFLGAFWCIFLTICCPMVHSGSVTAIELMFYGLYLFFMFLFLESMQRIKIINLRVSIVFSFLMIQQISLLLIILLHENTSITTHLWLMADVCYNSLGIFIYGIIGVKFYKENYQKTRARTSWLLIRIFFLIGIGYLLIFFLDLFWYFDIFISFGEILNIFANFLTILGVLSVLIIYLLNINHFYLDSHDLFLFMIADQQGKVLFSSQFRTQEGKSFSEASLSQLLSCINTIFTKTFESKSNVSFQISKEVSLIRESGKNISAVIVSNSLSRIMMSALRRFVIEFEEKIGILSASNGSNSKFIENTVNLMVENFPFLTNLSKMNSTPN